MALKLYDTATREVSEFVPLRPGHVGIYLCGATVQAAPHIGHLRPVIAFDILRRWLARCGYDVTLIRNITDIDDKILAKAAVAGVDWWAHAAAMEREFTDAYAAVGVLPPTYEPRATAHVPQMIELMRELIDAGHAYETGNGNVWFDVTSWPQYGELTRQRLADLAPESQGGADQPTTGPIEIDPRQDKRSPHDFALWKASKPSEPATASWDTPWGPGRPGWHLECSAMAQRYLGDEFDIHGGGLDLRFPHHENEQAQSRAAGHKFARRWMHSAWITQSGAKMSKSLGNGLLVSELLAQAPAPVVRYAIASVQYRSMLEWTKETLAEAQATWDRLVGFVDRASARLGADAPTRKEVTTAPLPAPFVEAMDDDLNTPAALAVVHDYLRTGNKWLSQPVTPRSVAETRKALVALRAMLDVLGLDPLDPQWAKDDASAVEQTLHRLLSTELAARAEARKAKDWAAADAIRDRLAAAGVAIEDTPAGARWSLAT